MHAAAAIRLKPCNRVFADPRATKGGFELVVPLCLGIDIVIGDSSLSTARGVRVRSPRELRAATSLARLWHHQDRTQEAHRVLAPVYDRFTEGFATADLRAAKALIGEISPTPPLSKDASLSWTPKMRQLAKVGPCP
jgi:hypothetical protein